MGLNTWKKTPLPTQVPTDGIHVWRIPLAGSASAIEQARQLLTPDELKRADRYIFDKHRRRFALGRAAMRRILGSYLQRPPDQLEFEYESLGKPRLARGLSGVGFCFNFSNSHELALLAVTHDVELGVDIEWQRDLLDMMGLARRFFCEAEIATLGRLADSARREAFFRCWTRKEAFLKAVGKGLTFPLNEVEVSCAADEPAEIRLINGQPCPQWSLDHFIPQAGYVAALARERQGDRVELFSLST